jgi:hypothetical protein
MSQFPVKKKCNKIYIHYVIVQHVNSEMEMKFICYTNVTEDRCVATVALLQLDFRFSKSSTNVPE